MIKELVLSNDDDYICCFDDLYQDITSEYVFDDTINHKAGWCQRMQLTMHLSQYSQLGTQLSQCGSL